MTKCPACKQYTITNKQRLKAAWCWKIKCSNCGSSLGIGYIYWNMVIMVFVMWFLEFIFHIKNKIFYYILFFIISFIITFVVNFFIRRLKIWYNFSGIDANEDQERMIGKRL
jgi:hypothetical protein